MPESKSKNLMMVVCALLHGLNHSFNLILPPLYLSIRDDLGLDKLSLVTLFGTVYFFTYAIMNLPFGILADKYSKKKILVYGAVLNSIAFVIAGWTRSYHVFLFAMLLAGLGGGTYHPVANAMISNLFKGMVGRAFGIIGMGASIGLFVGPFLSGLIGHQFGWRVSCLSFGIFGCLAAAGFSIVMPDEEEFQSKETRQSMPLKSLILSLAPIVLVFGLRDFCFWGTTAMTPAMSQDIYGFSKQTAGLLLGLMSVTGVVSQPLAGTLSDRLGRRRVLAIALCIAGPILIFFPYLGPFIIFPAGIIAGSMVLCTVPVVDAALSDVIPPSLRGRMYGITLTIGLLVGAFSPYVTGLAHDYEGGYRLVYSLLGAFALASAVMTSVIPKERPHA
ncbi:MAG: MFS transporter [Deltaproteobacteria bacterium]|nr:MFS transporter [Deltaproteobacteria bacterium]